MRSMAPQRHTRTRRPGGGGEESSYQLKPSEISALKKPLNLHLAAAAYCRGFVARAAGNRPPEGQMPTQMWSSNTTLSHAYLSPPPIYIYNMYTYIYVYMYIYVFIIIV